MKDGIDTDVRVWATELDSRASYLFALTMPLKETTNPDYLCILIPICIILPFSFGLGRAWQLGSIVRRMFEHQPRFVSHM